MDVLSIGAGIPFWHNASQSDGHGISVQAEVAAKAAQETQKQLA